MPDFDKQQEQQKEVIDIPEEKKEEADYIDIVETKEDHHIPNPFFNVMT